MRSPFETLNEVDDSWVYPDEESLASFTSHDTEDPTSDDDYFELRADPNAYAYLSAAEYSVIDKRFGLTGDATSMKDIASDLGVTHGEVREVLGSALSKMRTNLRDNA
ncbi:MAG TPA: hypothetical protein PLT55_03015 [Acidimicrobiia bacterium]|nr:hypothetical protein [Acidimicrobiia bacterium]